MAVLDADDWEALLEWSETVEELDIARSTLAELREAGSPAAAGWLEWDEVKQQLASTQAASVKLPRLDGTLFRGVPVWVRGRILQPSTEPSGRSVRSD